MDNSKSSKITDFSGMEAILEATEDQQQVCYEFCQKMENINNLVSGRKLEVNNKGRGSSASGKMAEYAFWNFLRERSDPNAFIPEPDVSIHQKASFDVDIPTETKNWHVKVCRGKWNEDYSWFWKKRDPTIKGQNSKDWFCFMLERKDLGIGVFQLMWLGRVEDLKNLDLFQETDVRNYYPSQTVVSHKRLESLDC